MAIFTLDNSTITHEHERDHEREQAEEEEQAQLLLDDWMNEDLDPDLAEVEEEDLILDLPDPEDPARPWAAIAHVQELSGLTLGIDAILQAIGWLHVENDHWTPCLNCLWYGWDDTGNLGNGNGKCANCETEEVDYDPTIVSDTWLHEQQRDMIANARALARALALD